MGVYFKMSLAYLKRNKLRTTLLIIGVALGIILIFSTSVIKESQYKNDVKAINKVYSGYHFELNDLSDENTEKVKKDKDVSKITTVQNLGEVTDNKGNSISLKSADENYIKEKSGKLESGRLPKNNNEIVLEKEALKRLGISQKLGNTLKFKVKKVYKEENGNNKVYEVDKEFKLVGIIKKLEGFYDFFDLNIPFEAFTYRVDKTNELIPSEKITYNSLISTKDGAKNPDGAAINLVMKYKLGEPMFDSSNPKGSSYMSNMPLARQLMDKKIDTENPMDYMRQVLIIVTSIIFVFNIFNITLNETIKEMGLLRLIGASKKNVRMMIVYQALAIMVVGIIVGLGVGAISSFIAINTSNPTIYQEAQIKPELYISFNNIKKAILTGVISVVVSSIIPIIKVGIMSSIESMRATDKFRGYHTTYKLGKILNKVFGFYGYMGLKNIGRNKTRAVISMMSIALGGYVFLTTFSSMKNEESNKILSLQERYDVTLQLGANSDKETFKYSQNDVKKLKDIDGVKSVLPIQFERGSLDITNIEVDKNFAKNNNISKENPEYKTNIKFYEPGYARSILKKYLEEGDTYNIGTASGGIPSVAVYNYYYDESGDKTFKKVFPDLKIGDIIPVKVAVLENGNTIYKESKVRVAAILKPEWMGKGDGEYKSNFEIVTESSVAKMLTGRLNYNKLGITLSDTYNKEVNKKVTKTSDSMHLSQYNSKLDYSNMAKESTNKNVEKQLSTIVLVLVIAGVNIFCTIRTNLLTRKKEISTLRAIGLSARNLRKMVTYEAITYAMISFVISLVPSISKLVKDVNWNNDAYKNFGIDKFMEFTFPVKESIAFFIISICICLIAVSTSSRELKNMSIIEGIKEND